MTFSWTPHRFAGGALALDVANSVVLRSDAARRIDRYGEVEMMDAFAGAANIHCAERDRTGPLVPVAPSRRAAFPSAQCSCMTARSSGAATISACSAAA